MTHSQGLQRLQTLWWGWRTLQMCIHVAAGLAPASPRRDGFMQTPHLLLGLWAARPSCSPWSCWLRCLLDLVRTWWDGGPGGSLTRDGSPSVSHGGCLWPPCFWGVRLPPHGSSHGASGWVYAGFWQGCLKALIEKEKEGKKVFNTFFLYFFLYLFFNLLVT